jgi:flavodoxin
MQTLVIYDSKFGNTEKIAEAIARGAGTTGGVRVMSTAEATVTQGPAVSPDLVFIGGPTQRRGASPALTAFLRTVPDSIRRVPVAPFDTRYRGPQLVMGSAAAEVAKVTKRSGTSTVAGPESFFVGRGGPMERQTLESGEIERAEAWGRDVATAVANQQSSASAAA